MEDINMNKIPLSVAIVVSVFILALGYGIVQTMKQNSIEKQQQLKIEEEKKAEMAKRVRTDLCIADAEESYWNYMELNGTKNDDGTITALQRHWDVADERKQNAINNCFKRY